MAEMNLKAIIALCMGLVIQLSQVQMSVAVDSSKLCDAKAHPMSCCAGLKSCPCAKESDSNQKPTPLVPDTVDLKLFVSKTAESTTLEAFISPPTDAVFSDASRPESTRGYAGVPLSVAFCRFVI